MKRPLVVTLLALAAAAGVALLFAGGDTHGSEGQGECGCDPSIEPEEAAYHFRFKERDYPVDVYRALRPTRGGVLLLHELPGMTPESICLAKRLAAEGYLVHMPLLFGERGESKGGRNFWRIFFHPGFKPFSRSNAAPISGELEQVVERLSADGGRRPVAVIGMCLTGHVPLNLLTDDRVAAGVLSQPALPFFPKSAVGVSDEQLDAVKDSGKPILAQRFEDDGWSPAARLKALKKKLGGKLETHVFQGDEHAILTNDCREEYLRKTLDFLAEHLADGAAESVELGVGR